MSYFYRVISTATRTYKKKDFLPGDTVSHARFERYIGKLFVAGVFMNGDDRERKQFKWTCRLSGFITDTVCNNRIGSFYDCDLCTTRMVLTEKKIDWDSFYTHSDDDKF